MLNVLQMSRPLGLPQAATLLPSAVNGPETLLLEPDCASSLLATQPYQSQVLGDIPPTDVASHLLNPFEIIRALIIQQAEENSRKFAGGRFEGQLNIRCQQPHISVISQSRSQDRQGV